MRNYGNYTSRQSVEIVNSEDASRELFFDIELTCVNPSVLGTFNSPGEGAHFDIAGIFLVDEKGNPRFPISYEHAPDIFGHDIVEKMIEDAKQAAAESGRF